MKKRKQRLTTAIVVISLCSLSRAVGQPGSHLEPEEGYFASSHIDHGYERVVRNVLVQDALESSPAGMVTIGSFGPETLVYLSAKDESFSIVAVTVSKQIWAVINPFSKNRDEKITTSQKEKKIDTDMAKQISAVFALALSQTRYPEQKTWGLDGAFYHFTARTEKNGMRSGQIWSPDADTICGRLVQLGDDMTAYVHGDVAAEKLASECRELMARLKEKK